MYRLFLFEYSICINLDKIIIVLFESRKPVTIPSKDADIFYDPCFFNTKKADKIFKTLKTILFEIGKTILSKSLLTLFEKPKLLTL